MWDFSKLENLNVLAALLHGIQAIIVGALIPSHFSSNTDQASLSSGIYVLQKNIYVLRIPNTTPLCGLPPLQNFSTAASLTLYNIIHPTLQIQSTNFYQFQNSIAIPANLMVGYLDVRYLILSFFSFPFYFRYVLFWGGLSPGPAFLISVFWAYPTCRAWRRCAFTVPIFWLVCLVLPTAVKW